MVNAVICICYIVTLIVINVIFLMWGCLRVFGGECDGTSSLGFNGPQKLLKSQSPQVQQSRITLDSSGTIPEVSRMVGPFPGMHGDGPPVWMTSQQCTYSEMMSSSLNPIKSRLKWHMGFFLVWNLRGTDCSWGCHTLCCRYPKWLLQGIGEIQNKLSTVFCSQIVTLFFSFTLD